MRPSHRRDCDLTLENWGLHTTQINDRTIKHWHPRAPSSLAESLLAGDRPGWTVLDRPGAPTLLFVSCALVIGLIESCAIGGQPIIVRNWVYLPPRDGGGPLGLLVLIVADGVADRDGADHLVLRTSFDVIEAGAAREPFAVGDLPHDAKIAILLLAAGEALADAESAGVEAWSRLAAALSVSTGDPGLPDMRAYVSTSADGIHVRGVIGVSAWPITVITGGSHLELMRPVRLDTSEMDVEGEVLFELTTKTVRPPTDAPLPPLLLLATDNIYRLVAA